LPDHKIGVAPIIDEIEDCIQIIKKLKQKTSIYIHCLAGIERSPLICMAWLIKEHKLSMEESMEYMMQVHPNTNPHKEQLDLLKSI
jgi:protein-tyrosine phosphatase